MASSKPIRCVAVKNQTTPTGSDVWDQLNQPALFFGAT